MTSQPSFGAVVASTNRVTQHPPPPSPTPTPAVLPPLPSPSPNYFVACAFQCLVCRLTFIASSPSSSTSLILPSPFSSPHPPDYRHHWRRVSNCTMSMSSTTTGNKPGAAGGGGEEEGMEGRGGGGWMR